MARIQTILQQEPHRDLVCGTLARAITMAAVVEAAHDAPSAGTTLVVEACEILFPAIPIGVGRAGNGIAVVNCSPALLYFIQGFIDPTRLEATGHTACHRHYLILASVELEHGRLPTIRPITDQLKLCPEAISKKRKAIPRDHGRKSSGK